jgi:hypothetical protein
MDYIGRLTAAKGVIIIGVIGLVLFFAGFWLARSTAASPVNAGREGSRYQFMQIGDTVAAIDIYTGETYAIDGNTRAWALLAPALPSKEVKTTK